MFIESLKYGLHLATPDNLCVQQRILFICIFSTLYPLLHTTPFCTVYLFVTAELQSAVCFLILFAIIYICIFQLQSWQPKGKQEKRGEREGQGREETSWSYPSEFVAVKRGVLNLRFINCTLLQHHKQIVFNWVCISKSQHSKHPLKGATKLGFA